MLLLLPALVTILRGDQATETQDDPIAQLVKRLGSGAFAVRQDASRKLIAMGEKAIPDLRKAALSSVDLETQRRAAELMIAILPKVRKSATTSMELVLIESGSFDMGSPIGEKGRRPDEDRFGVRLKEPYYLGMHEVRQGEFEKIMEFNQSWFHKTGAGSYKLDFPDTRHFPVENVTWFDAIEFCNRLSKQEELPSYYKVEDVKREGKVIRNAKVTILGGNGYRLPTEAEWEFACRANSDQPFYFGKSATGREGNFKSSVVAGGYGAGPLWRALERTERAGAYPANGFNLHEMHGNVAEWCWDYYGPYPAKLSTNPQGPDKGTHRVVRGGSWLVTEASCRSASRLMQIPGEFTYNVGFRVARNP